MRPSSGWNAIRERIRINYLIIESRKKRNDKALLMGYKEIYEYCIIFNKKIKKINVWGHSHIM